MKTIPLSGSKGLSTLVDDEDYAWLSQFTWWPLVSGRIFQKKRIYVRNEKLGFMHRAILMRYALKNRGYIDPEKDTDHIDRNGLNNQKSNLRLVSRTENNHNSNQNQNNKSGVKGVSFDRSTKRWQACASVNNKTVKLYSGDSFEEACSARRNWESSLRRSTSR